MSDGAVAILGATQPLGRALTARLLAAGRPVVAVGLEAPTGLAGARYERVDLTAPGSLRALLHGPCRAVRTVVNLAFHRDPHAPQAHRLNVELARELVAVAEAHPTVAALVHRSSADVYARRSDRPHLVREDQPLELDPAAPPWVRQRVEADLVVSTPMGTSPLRICVLRCAEILAPDQGSQLYDYLSSRICLRPMGFDPMVNVLSLTDAADAFARAVAVEAEGPFNVPGADTLPLSRLIRAWGRTGVGVPGPLLGPLYAARRAARRTRFRYGANAWRFHYNGVLDGTRAAEGLGYRPAHPLRTYQPSTS
ncbi:MAG: NAD-dependent epimerase/dehydratase family protein [Myxococcota bacterium]